MINTNSKSAPERDELLRVCHDLRNLVTAINGYAALIPGSSPDEISRFVTEVRTAAGKMAEIMNDALDRAKLTNGAYKAPSRIFDVAAQLETVQSVFSGPAKEKGISLSLSIAEDVPARVIGSPLHVSETLTNLITNALKFTQEGGSISIRAELGRSAETIRFSVTDNGPGMPPDLCERLFQPFVQGEHNEGGTGLGLALCRRFMQELGGEIGVTSQLGQGSTFYFIVPFQSVGEAETEPDIRVASAPQTISAGEQEKKTALVVDDETGLSMLLQSVLRNFGYQTDVAVDIDSALTLLEATEYTAIVVDLSLGGASGKTLISEIRRRKGKNRHAAIIATSGYGDSEAAIAAGAMPSC